MEFDPNVNGIKLNYEQATTPVHTLLQHRFYLIIKAKDTYKHYMDEGKGGRETWKKKKDPIKTNLANWQFTTL